MSVFHLPCFHVSVVLKLLKFFCWCGSPAEIVQRLVVHEFRSRIWRVCSKAVTSHARVVIWSESWSECQTVWAGTTKWFALHAVNLSIDSMQESCCTGFWFKNCGFFLCGCRWAVSSVLQFFVVCRQSSHRTPFRSEEANDRNLPHECTFAGALFWFLIEVVLCVFRVLSEGIWIEVTWNFFCWISHCALVGKSIFRPVVALRISCCWGLGIEGAKQLRSWS